MTNPGRRNISDPRGAAPAVTYANLRRAPGSTAAGSGVRVPMSSALVSTVQESGLVRRTSSGLSQEVIEISSDDEEEDDNESDEGVRVDIAPVEVTTYAGRGGRARRGRR